MKKILSVLLSLVFAFSCFSVVCLNSENVYAKTFSEGDFSVQADELRRPAVLKKGASFTIKGKLKANREIEKMELRVTDMNSFKKELKYSEYIYSKKINLSDYSQKLNFSKLSSGEKEFKIILFDEEENKLVIKRRFTVLGKAKESVHITKQCRITVSKGDVSSVTDSSDSTSWSSGKMEIVFPEDKKVDGIFIKWHKASTNSYTIKSYSADGEVLDEYSEKSYEMLHKYYKMSDGAVKAVIKLKKTKDNNGICCLRVYEEGRVGASVERWEAPETGKCDLMVISAHRDDELLYFGGTIPYYLKVKEKNVYTVYMSGRDRLRIREALAGQWSMGNTTYPIFMDFPGGYHDGISGTLQSWGGEEAVLKKLVEKIRRFQPDVIVSHDINGEYGHPTHKTTAYLIQKAIKLAGDKSKYKESYEKYGAWNVKKLYLHMYSKNKITMNWNKSYAKLDGKTPFQAACVAYDKHVSQHGSWSMTSKKVTKYPNNKYGLVYSSVGADKKKNDFFENVKPKNEESQNKQSK